MSTTSVSRPLPRCPARHGGGADIRTAEFVLATHDYGQAQGAGEELTEVFGYFHLPGEEHDGDALLTGGFDIPPGSPIACLAREVAGDPDRVRCAGDVLRRYIAGCPCPESGECPALNDIRLLEAIEYAISAVS